jgi:adenylosuccinate lyase
MRLTSGLVERVAREGITLREAATADARVSSLLPAPALERTLDPAAYLGSTTAFIDRALRSWRDVRQAGTE